MSEPVVYCKACKFPMNVGTQVESTSETMFRVHPPIKVEGQTILGCPRCGAEETYSKTDIQVEDTSGKG